MARFTVVIEVSSEQWDEVGAFVEQDILGGLRSRDSIYDPIVTIASDVATAKNAVEGFLPNGSQAFGPGEE